MPYRWSPTPPSAPQRLHLWAHQSLSPRGFVGFVGVTAIMLALPLITQLGHPGLWVLLPCLLAALAGLWAALARDRAITEDLTMSADEVTLTRHGPHGRRQDWQANPHWLRLALHESGGPVPQYLTLSGGGRVVELGAFLTAAERLALKGEIERLLVTLR